MSTIELQLHQCSLHTESAEWALGAPAQIEAALGRGALAVGFTEVSERSLGSDTDAFTLHAFYRMCAEHDYTLYHGGGDTALAWDNHFALIDKGEVPTTKNHALRWVTLDYHGERVTVVEQHWLTRHAGDNDAKRAEQSRIVSEVVKAHGTKRDVAFWMGDTNSSFQNVKDSTRVALNAAGLVSAYEALDTYPKTLGRATCDVIGHYAEDKRVKAVRVETYDALGSDHVPVSAFYSIAQ